MPTEVTFLTVLLSYFVGAIPVGVLVAKAHKIDIFATGSGNIGATNVNRALGLKWALFVFILDVLKGLVPAFVARYFSGTVDQAFIHGLAAVVGHTLSPFIRFKGGKGVATGLGALLGSMPVVGMCALSLFGLTVLITRWISFGAIIAAVSLLPLSLVMHTGLLSNILCGGMGAYVVFRHRANITRLLKGTEPKINLKRSNKSVSSSNTSS